MFVLSLFDKLWHPNLTEAEAVNMMEQVGGASIESCAGHDLMSHCKQCMQLACADIAASAVCLLGPGSRAGIDGAWTCLGCTSDMNP